MSGFLPPTDPGGLTVRLSPANRGTTIVRLLWPVPSVAEQSRPACARKADLVGATLVDSAETQRDATALDIHDEKIETLRFSLGAGGGFVARLE